MLILNKALERIVCCHGSGIYIYVLVFVWQLII